MYTYLCDGLLNMNRAISILKWSFFTFYNITTVTHEEVRWWWLGGVYFIGKRQYLNAYIKNNKKEQSGSS